MKEAITYCNHCGKPIEKIRDFTFFRIKKGDKWETADLCEECYDMLTHIVQLFCTRRDSNDR